VCGREVSSCGSSSAAELTSSMLCMGRVAHAVELMSSLLCVGLREGS
jgi:hypothetical protein